MKTLIIPCGGKSSRFPGMRPKWLLTHPDGNPMFKKAVSGIDLSSFDRVIYTIIKQHEETYGVTTIFEQVFLEYPENERKKFEYCILDDFTSSASETVYLTLKKKQVHGAFVVKDSDNYLSFEVPDDDCNAVVCADINKFNNIKNIPNKSFISRNENGVILNIVEKHIISNCVCLGSYMFKDAGMFIDAYDKIYKANIPELFISNLISYLIVEESKIFVALEAKEYDDWGTVNEWRDVQKKFTTYFVDFDGVLLKNSGRYGKVSWANNTELLIDNCVLVRKLQESGSQIIITTSRPAEYKKFVLNLLNSVGIKPYDIIMGLNHAPRVLINDFAPSNPYPSAIAISFPRDDMLKKYL